MDNVADTLADSRRSGFCPPSGVARRRVSFPNFPSTAAGRIGVHEHADKELIWMPI
ncbi:hypothetical protein PUN4_630032 [Paraburkholderia unamae]|nr:hypothetical protein PUN4_630032 [Paraburkholderia unamae]